MGAVPRPAARAVGRGFPAVRGRRLLVASVVLLTVAVVLVALRKTSSHTDEGFVCAGVAFVNATSPGAPAGPGYSTPREAVDAFVRLNGGDPADWLRRDGWYVRTGH